MSHFKLWSAAGLKTCIKPLTQDTSLWAAERETKLYAEIWERVEQQLLQLILCDDYRFEEDLHHGPVHQPYNPVHHWCVQIGQQVLTDIAFPRWPYGRNNSRGFKGCAGVMWSQNSFKCVLQPTTAQMWWKQWDWMHGEDCSASAISCISPLVS